jgi:ArsR family transcriptional regulator, arsenate/arsenite/antimonite-responsive transcriptional repressor
MANYKSKKFNSLLAIFKTLGDSNRLRIYISFVDRELCVYQIVELLQLAPSTDSKHLLILKQAGILKSRKSGRWIYHSISNYLLNPRSTF